MIIFIIRLKQEPNSTLFYICSRLLVLNRLNINRLNRDKIIVILSTKIIFILHKFALGGEPLRKSFFFIS